MPKRNLHINHDDENARNHRRWRSRDIAIFNKHFPNPMEISLEREEDRKAISCCVEELKIPEHYIIVRKKCCLGWNMSLVVVSGTFMSV